MDCRAGTTQNDGIVGYLTAFRGMQSQFRDRYYTDKPNCAAPAFISGMQSRFAGQVLHKTTELCCTCLGNRATGRQGRQNEIRWQGREGRVT